MKRCTVVPYEGEQDYLFISYSHKDAEVSVPIIEQLAAEGYRIWYDEGIDPGSEWPETIAAHLSGASACIGLISGNYLASDNCRRELNFALKRQIPFLSIMLEEVQMSAGVEMQLSANQAIFKYKLPSNEIFLQKVRDTRSIQSARKLPEPPQQEEKPARTEPEKETPDPSAASQTAKPTDGKQTEDPAAEKRVVKAAKQPGPKTQGSNKKRLLTILGAVTAVLFLIAVGIVIAVSTGKKATQETDAGKTLSSVTEATASDTYDLSAPDAPIERDELLNTPYARRMLWGRKQISTYADKDSFVSHASFRDVALGGGIFNISVHPFAFEVLPDQAPDIIRLYYYDMLGAEFIIQGAYTINNGTLTITNATSYEDALALDEPLSYGLKWSDNYLYLYAKEKNNTATYCAPIMDACGAADGAIFDNISAMDIPSPADGTKCTLYFSDGGKTKDAYVDDIYPNIYSIYLEWSKETRLYNGSMADFDVRGGCYFHCLNTYPYGFILNHNGDIYFYQNPLPAEAD